MLIIGHPWIKSQRFFKVFAMEGIQKSQAEDMILLGPLVDSHSLAVHCQENNVPYAILAHTLDDAIFANALGAKYIICEADESLNIQSVANEYLFDARILVRIESEKEISKSAKCGVDGVIFADAIYEN